MSLSLAQSGTKVSCGALMRNVSLILQQAMELTTEKKQIKRHNSLHGYLLQVGLIATAM